MMVVTKRSQILRLGRNAMNIFEHIFTLILNFCSSHYRQPKKNTPETSLIYQFECRQFDWSSTTNCLIIVKHFWFFWQIHLIFCSKTNKIPIEPINVERWSFLLYARVKEHFEFWTKKKNLKPITHILSTIDAMCSSISNFDYNKSIVDASVHIGVWCVYRFESLHWNFVEKKNNNIEMKRNEMKWYVWWILLYNRMP